MNKALPYLLLFGFLMACAGPDYMPQYFPSASTSSTTDNRQPTTNDQRPTGPTGSCTVNFTSELCVTIKGDNIEVGTGENEPLCTEIDPIPIEVSGGTNLILRGSTFPDIPFEGHGLPAPITINGKGTTDGSQNIGEGRLGQDGSITIEGFSFFINALGMVGEIPELTLTTETVEGLPDLPDIEGSKLDGRGNLKLVAGTVIGHLFPAADERLLGASLQATLEGSIAPPLSQCQGQTSRPESTFVTKIVINQEGRQTEGLLPGSTRMEIGSQTFIAENSTDVGPNFESSARFKIVNATNQPISINIPPVVGSFTIETVSGGGLIQNLPPSTPLIINVTFRPTTQNTPEPGEIIEIITIGADLYQLVGQALTQSGRIVVDIVNEAGGIIQGEVGAVEAPEVSVSASQRREFFMCQSITCEGAARPTSCVACVDVLTNTCQLLTVDQNGNPIEEVDANCGPKNPSGRSSFTINTSSVLPSQKIIQIKNTGARPAIIQSIEIQDLPGSNSPNQFRTTIPATLPATLTNQTLQLVIVYEPNDLIGSDGTEAVASHPAHDRAILYITTDSGNISVELSGRTTVREAPALEVYFKTSTGTRQQVDGSIFPFRGVTMETTDLAAPLFIKLSDSATSTVRITNIEISGQNFEWLDTEAEINAKPDTARCTIPTFDANGGQTGMITNLSPASLANGGLDLQPGAYTVDNMPLFGCVNFHPTGTIQRQRSASLIIHTQEVGRDGSPIRNEDGSIKQTDFTVGLLAVVNPFKGRLVFRLTQTMAAIMNPQFPSISAGASAREIEIQIANRDADENDRFLTFAAVTLDPFDEETIRDEQGNVLTTPGDGITAVYRKIDTHPVDTAYDDPLLADYTALIYDGTAPEGNRGIFFDYETVPSDLKIGGLRIFTAGLSYPGPLARPSERPENILLCEQVNPCSPEGQRKFGTGPTEAGKRGVCAFFYTSAGRWTSPAIQEHEDLCRQGGQPQDLIDVNGYYDLNGSINFEDVGLKLWGPTYFHNPSGPLGPVPPMDAIFHTAFTTDVIIPNNTGVNLIPDERVNIGRQEHKINLTDTRLETPRLCETSVRNRTIQGQQYSTWRYLAPLLSIDEEGAIPAGCPEPGNNLTGGSAFLHGRKMDQETGIVTFVGNSKFASDDNLTFAFKDVPFFIVFNGWICDPTGPEDDFEGSHCFDRVMNQRDGLSTITMME